MKAVLIPADSRAKARVVDEEMTLEYWQKVVGGYVEQIYLERVLTDHGLKPVDCAVLVNEDGRAVFDTPNNRATDLCAMKLGGAALGGIVWGDVLVVGPPDSNGDCLPLSDDVVSIVDNWDWL